MNKAELVNTVSTKTGLSKKDTTTTVDGILNEITQTLALNEEVNIAGFGKFSVTETAERNGVNPKSGEKLLIPAGKKPKFKAAKALKDSVNV